MFEHAGLIMISAAPNRSLSRGRGELSVKPLRIPLSAMVTAKSSTVTPARNRGKLPIGWLTSRGRQGSGSKTQTLLRLVKKVDIEGIRKIAHTIAPEDVNTQDRRGNTALYYAVQSSLRLTQLLVTMGAGVNRHCEEGNTPLHAALASGQDTVAQFLLRQGADPSCRNAAKKAPCQVASDRLVNRLELASGMPLTTPELLVKLQPRSHSTRIHTKERKLLSRPDIVLYQLPKSVRENRLLLRNKGIRRNSPLYPTPMRSGVRFRGDCLSPSEGTSLYASPNV